MLQDGLAARFASCYSGASKVFNPSKLGKSSDYLVSALLSGVNTADLLISPITAHLSTTFLLSLGKSPAEVTAWTNECSRAYDFSHRAGDTTFS